MYLATRSERDGAPVLIWPVPIATTRSAIVVSSVSPERCDTTADQPAPRASSIASIVSVSVPIWLSLISTALAARSSMPRAIRSGLVTSRSSPTSWTRVAEPLGELLPAGPVVLGQAVLERRRSGSAPTQSAQRSTSSPVVERPALLGQDVAVGAPSAPVPASTSSVVAGSSAMATSSPGR